MTPKAAIEKPVKRNAADRKLPKPQGIGRLTGRLPKPKSTATISATSQSRSVTPAAIAGVNLECAVYVVHAPRTAVRCAGFVEVRKDRFVL